MANQAVVIFAAWLKEALENAQLTKVEIAEKSGVTRQTIERIVKANAVPGLDTADRLARCFGTTLSAILAGQPAPSPNVADAVAIAAELFAALRDRDVHNPLFQELVRGGVKE